MAEIKEVIVKEIVTESYKWVCPGCKYTWILKRDKDTKIPEKVTCKNCKKEYNVVK